MNQDALASFKPRGEGLFVKVKEGDPVTLRVLTLDPIVAMDTYGNTRFSFIVWNWTENRAQILQKGASVLKQLTAIHTDPDFDAINKMDIKLSATGEGKETRYSVQVLQKTNTLTNDQIKEAQKIDLEKAVPNGIRLSQYNDGEDVPEVEQDDYEGEPEVGPGLAKARAISNQIKEKSGPSQEELDSLDLSGSEEINLDDIPF